MVRLRCVFFGMRANLLAWFVALAPALLGQVGAVHSIEELEAAVKAAKPGELVTIRDGVYGQPANLQAQGRPGKPVTVRAETSGGVMFAKPVTLSGSWLTLEGAAFRGQASLTIKGTGIRLSRGTFSECQSMKWVQVQVGSKQVEIDRCLFENKEINRSKNTSCQVLQLVVQNKGERHHIHHNHFRNILKGRGSNGFETIQLITHRNPFDPPGGDCETRIEDNLFEKCNGESEIISVKSNGNVIRRNTFRACRGELALRHGHRNVAAQNFFFGDGEEGSGGVRLQGRDQLVVNNYFHALGKAAIAMMDGTPDKLYMPVERARVLHNTVIDCRAAMAIGLNHSKHPNGTAPAECVIAGNAFLSSDPKAGLIQYVQDDMPEKWVWEDNYYHGLLGIPAVDGLSEADLGFVPDEDRIARPTSKTPTMKCDLEATPKWMDAFGIERREKTAVGALELSDQKPKHGPLSANQVGPGL